MISFIAVVALFGYILYSRREFEAAIRTLSRRLERLESQMVPAPAPAAARIPVSSPPPTEHVQAPAAAPVSIVGVASPASPVPSAPMFAAVAAVEEEPAPSLESEIGSRWLLYVGVVALVVGAAYFQKLAIDNEWIGERARVIEGLVAGLLLVAGGRWFVRRGYEVYGQIVAGGGIAVLYVSVYAASTLYELIGRGSAFAALCAVTALAAWLADRYRSQALAVMAVGGGFATPFLLPTSTDAQVALFTYDGVLIAGTMYLSHRRVWPLLNVVSYLLTALTVLAWAASFYTPSKYLVTEAYLTVFCGMFLYILFQVRNSDAPGAFEAKAVLWSAPAVYYMASIAVLEPHGIAYLIFLGSVASIAAALAPFGHAWIRLGVWCAIAVPLLAWVGGHADEEWMIPGLAAVGGIYAVNLLAHLHGMTREEGLKAPDIALLHLNPLVLFAAAYVIVDGTYPDASASLAFSAAVWNGLIAAGLWGYRRSYALHFAGVAGTLLAVAVGLQFDGEARTIGWSAEGAAVIWLGLLERRGWLRIGGLVVLAIAVLQFLALLPDRPSADYTVVLNWRAACGLFLIALLYVLAWLHRSVALGPVSATAPFVIVANSLTLMLLTTEINAYWYVRSLATAETTNHLGRQLTLSISWALYATGLIIVGLWRQYAPIRYLAMTVFAVTIVKVFFFDLDELEQIYRVLSVIGLGVLLLLTSYLYNRRTRRI